MMTVQHFGLAHRYFRKMAGLSIDALAEKSLVGRATIICLEQGEDRLPQTDTIHSLYKEIGVNPHNLVTGYKTMENPEISDQVYKLDTCLYESKYNEASDIIHRLEADEQFMQEWMNVRHIRAAKAVLANAGNAVPEDILFMLEKVLPNINDIHHEEQILDILLTHIEYFSLDVFAQTLSRVGESVRSTVVYKGMIENTIRNNKDKHERGQRLTMLYLRLAENLYVMKQYNEAVEICLLGRKMCNKSHNLDLMHKIAIIQIRCHIELGEQKEGLSLSRQLFHVHLLLQDIAKADEVKVYVKENFDIDFIF